MTEILRLRSPIGQIPHGDIDRQLLRARLAGREVERTLGTVSVQGLHVTDHMLDDETVFILRMEESDMGSETPPDTSGHEEHGPIGGVQGRLF